MGCLKCGKTMKEDRVFCAECLEIMETYPVKPDVRIQLPNRRTWMTPLKASKKRRPPSMEEQLAILRRRQRRLVIVIAVLSFLLCAAGFMMTRTHNQPDESEWGKNYTLDDTAG